MFESGRGNAVAIRPRHTMWRCASAAGRSLTKSLRRAVTPDLDPDPLDDDELDIAHDDPCGEPDDMPEPDDGEDD